ncbi:class I SAM-dependent methyltransferase, partial [Streptomyces sp. UNOC14_S4]|uniref:class I SAM-dependent methyltransferase n=1 Tax=Streptomyces sp. UNOC14_S4 TaxID=2872340 RepID=UPI001E304CB7
FTAAAEETGAHCWAAALAGLLTDPAVPFGMPDLLDGGLQPHHPRLVRLMLPLLARHGLATAVPDSHWRLTGAPYRCRELLRGLIEDHPAFGSETALLNQQLLGLSTLLREAEDAPAPAPVDDTTLEQLQDTAPGHRFTHRVARTLLEHVVRQWPRDRPLRVLELGAGTLALTAALLPALPADRTRYTYTDVTAAAFARAEHRFADHDVIDHRVLDPDADPLSQGFTEGGYDLVVAGDGLHRADDLADTLRRLHTLLAPGGLLLAIEPHHSRRLALLHGTTSTFWQRRDRTLRPETRLLPDDRWRPLLAECGFTGTVQLGTDDRTVLLAAADRPAPPPLSRAAGSTWLVAGESPAEDVARQALVGALGTARAVTATADPATWTAELTAGDTRHDIVLLLAEQPEQPDSRHVVARTCHVAAVLRALAHAHDALPGSARPRVWLVTRPTG